MLPPKLVLTTKKQVEAKIWRAAALAGIVALLAGCGQPGPRALLEGDRLLQDEKYTAAIEPLQKAVALLPNNALAWNQLGFARHHAGLYNDADIAYRRAVNLNPNLATARWNLGCLHLEVGDPREAALQFGSTVVLDAKDTEARLLQAVALIRAGKADEAERHFKQILAAQGVNAEVLNGIALAQLMRKRPRDSAPTLFTALQANPSHRPATFNLAVVNHLHLNNKTQALAYYQRYLAMQPKPPFYNEVTALARALDAELHPPVLTNAPPPTNHVTLPPAVAPTNRLAPTITNQPAPRTNVTPRVPAVTVTNRPVGRTNVVSVPPTVTSPPPSLVLTSRPVTVSPITNLPPPRATTTAEVVEAASPKVTNLTVAPPPVEIKVRRYPYLRPATPAPGDRQKAMTLFQAGEKAREDQRLPDALMNYEAATKVDPAFLEAYQRLGRAALDAGDLPKGLVALEQALAMDPDASATRFNFAVGLHQAGYPADAAEEFERFYANNPKSTNGRLFLAHIYLQELKDVPRARAQYQKLLEVEPQHPQAASIREWLRRNQ